MSLPCNLGSSGSKQPSSYSHSHSPQIWIKTSEVLAFFVFDAFTELFITLCIVVNVFFMSLDHYTIEYDGMSPSFKLLLDQGRVDQKILK